MDGKGRYHMKEHIGPGGGEWDVLGEAFGCREVSSAI